MLSKLITTFSVLAIALLSAAPSTARIVGLTAPSTVASGDTIDVTFRTASFSENNLQYYVIFGLAPPDYDGLNYLLGTGYDLVTNGHSSTGSGSFDVPVTVPAEFKPSSPGAEYTLKAVVFGTVSASGPEFASFLSRCFFCNM